MVRFSRLASHSNYPVARVANLLQRRPQYGANERGVDRTDDSQIRYIRITDVDSVGRLAPGFGATAEVIDNRYLLNDGDILLARSGNTAGKSYMYSVGDGPSIFAGYMIRFCFDAVKIRPVFAFIYTQLPVYNLWVQATRRLTGQPNINAEEYRNLTIPIPPTDVQSRIVEQYNQAMQAYSNAISEAAALLASIDKYLLSELGIFLPPEPENTLANRTFRVSAHELGGWRFDPTFFSKKYVGLTDALEGRAHRRLGEVCTLSNENWDQASLFTDTFPYLEISEIDIGTGAIGTVTETPISEAPSRARMIVRQNDILVSTTRPSRGAITLADERLEYPIIASTGFALIRRVASSLIDREFLFYVLRSKIGLWQMEQRSSGGNYPAITSTEMKRLIIPTPDLELQRQIVEGCKQRISDALLLRQKATAKLEAAKRDIEVILLGDRA